MTIGCQSKEYNTEASRSSWNYVVDIDYDYALPARPALRNASRPRRSRPSSGVSFAPKSKVYVINYPDDYDRAQGSFNQADEAKFKQEAREDIISFLRLSRGSIIPLNQQHNMCLVGIEQYFLSPDPVNQRARLRKLVSSAVLTEQTRLDSEDCIESKSARIARISRNCTKQELHKLD